MEAYTLSQTELEQVFFLWGQMTASGGSMPADQLAKITLWKSKLACVLRRPSSTFAVKQAK